jgi:Fic family protein
MPKTRSEKEIAGYRDVLATIHENYEYIPPVSSNMILQLHRDSYKFNGNGYGGNFKSTDNVIAEELPDGTKRVRFESVPVWETAETINNLCDSFKNACNMQTMDVLLLLPMFILDFLCIHPFNDDVIIRKKLENPSKIKGLALI